MQIFRRAILALASAGLTGCLAAAPRSAPLFPPLPARSAEKAPPSIHARAWKTEGPADPKEYPDGTRRVEAGMRVGDLTVNHNEFHVPAGKDAQRRWDFSKIALAGGSALIGDSLNWQAGNRGYSPWSFLGVLGKLPGEGTAKAVELLKPSVCIAAASAEGKGRAVAEMVFQRPVDATHAMSFAVRIERLAGDPWVYLLLEAEPAPSTLVAKLPLRDGPPASSRLPPADGRPADDPGSRSFSDVRAEGGPSAREKEGTIERVSLHGYPNSPHPIFYDLHYEWPRNATFLLRERWVWAAGQDWNLHDAKQPHSTPIGAVGGASTSREVVGGTSTSRGSRRVDTPPTGDTPPTSGVFFYNRHNSETGGMMAVFLPEEVADFDAAGTYGVSVTFGLRRPAIRLALRTWYDMRGWEPVRRDFLAELPERVKRLREMSFAWPETDPLGKDAARAEQLLAAAPPGAEIAPLRAAYDDYRAAAARLKALTIPDSPERHKTERAALLAAESVRTAMAPLLKQWIAKGSEFKPGH